jgi:hypothetical protein
MDYSPPGLQHRTPPPCLQSGLHHHHAHTSHLSLRLSQITYVMFHYVTGTPFEGNNGGVYDRLTLWEQIDQGAQYTPAKKWLTILPILL